MEEQKTLSTEVASEGYDAADRPFDFLGDGSTTALVCDSDPAVREKICSRLKELGYLITVPVSAKDALKAMRFCLFDILVVNEHFDTANPEMNDLLQHLENLNMAIRRRLFVALISEKCETMDNMAAFRRSVNIVINPRDVDEIGKIVKHGIADDKVFYHVFQETLQKTGKA